MYERPSPRDSLSSSLCDAISARDLRHNRTFQTRLNSRYARRSSFRPFRKNIIYIYIYIYIYISGVCIAYCLLPFAFGISIDFSELWDFCPPRSPTPRIRLTPLVSTGFENSRMFSRPVPLLLSSTTRDTSWPLSLPLPFL